MSIDYLFLIFSIFLFLLWLIFFLNDRNLNKNGVKVFVTVKDIKDRRDKNNYLIGKDVIVDFEYNGHRKLQLYDNQNVKLGDKIKCIYDVKNNYLSRIKQSKVHYGLLISAIFMILVFILVEYSKSVSMEENIINKFFVDMAENHNTGFAMVVTIFTLLPPIPFIIVGIYFYKKSKVNDNYIKINGIVKDILKHNHLYSDGSSRDVYAPVFEFNYNGQTMTYSNPFYTSNLNYKIGDNVILFMDSSTGKIIEKKESKSNKKLGILLIVIPILYILIEIIFAILKR